MYELAVIVHQKEKGNKTGQWKKKTNKHGYLVHLHRHTKKVKTMVYIC